MQGTNSPKSLSCLVTAQDWFLSPTHTSCKSTLDLKHEQWIGPPYLLLKSKFLLEEWYISMILLSLTSIGCLLNSTLKVKLEFALTPLLSPLSLRRIDQLKLRIFVLLVWCLVFIYKIITKVLAVRLSKVLSYTISESQRAFIPDKLLSEGTRLVLYL